MLNACGHIHTQVGMPNVSMLKSETPMSPSLTSSVAANTPSCSFCRRTKKSYCLSYNGYQNLTNLFVSTDL